MESSWGCKLWLTNGNCLDERQHEPLRDAGFCYLMYSAFFNLHGNAVACECERWGAGTLHMGGNVPCSTFRLCCARCQVPWVRLSRVTACNSTRLISWFGKKWRKGLSWAAFLHVIWRVCSQLCSPIMSITICFAWNLWLQVGRMSSYADICGSKHAQGSTEGGYQRYGVRSYLHQFYEDCTASIWEYEDDFQIQRSPSRWSSAFWKVLSVAVYWREKLPFQDFPI